jgi:1-aminocyclopropane-1-carboxylate deaminase/D-cysteine desulfhydrase-like pyridoxal-dependent ACC family enzyme
VIVAEPVAENTTEAVAALVVVPSAGDVIVRVGAVPRLTVTDLVSEPNELVQTTVMVFAPTTSGTVAGLVAAVPLTVQLIGVEPVVVHVTEVDVAAVLLLLAGAVIVTTGAVPRLIVIDLVSVPNALVATTVTVFAPVARLTVAGLDAADPFTV